MNKIQKLVYDFTIQYSKLRTGLAERCKLYETQNGLDQPIDPVSSKVILDLNAVHWTGEEIDFSADKAVYDALPESLKIIARDPQIFFSSGDRSVLDYYDRFALEAVDSNEHDALVTIKFNETIHATSYLLSMKILEPDRFHDFISQCEHNSGVKAKNDWIEKNVTLSTESKPYRHVAATCAEYSFFNTLFCMVLYAARLAEKPIRSLSTLNTYVSRDEAIHCKYNAHLAFKHARLEGISLDPAKITAIIKSATELECQFVDTLTFEDTGILTKAALKQYSQMIGDRIANLFNLPPIYGATNPFDYMETIGLLNRENTYEISTTSYVRQTIDHTQTAQSIDSNYDEVDF